MSRGQTLHSMCGWAGLGGLEVMGEEMVVVNASKVGEYGAGGS